MIRRLLLLAVAGICVADGLYLDGVIPAWRQLLFPVLAAAAYLHGRHLPARRDWVLLALAALPLVFRPAHALDAVMCLVLFAALPWLAGTFRRRQADLVVAGRERIAQLELAALRERARIAADMHDSLGHELALIALRAGALELDPGLSPPHREAVAALRESAVTATDRLRSTLELLRFDSVETLVERARSAGLVITLRGDAASVPDVVPRLVQETLTNAARHAPGSAVAISITRADGGIVVSVRNDAPAAPFVPGSGLTSLAPFVPGSGLASLRERLESLGGSLQVSSSRGVFEVTGRLPGAGRA